MNTQRAHEIIDQLAKIEVEIAEAHEESKRGFDSKDDEAIRKAWDKSRALVIEKNDLRNELMKILH